jgi:hypothetical protein
LFISMSHQVIRNYSDLEFPAYRAA